MLNLLTDSWDDVQGSLLQYTIRQFASEFWITLKPHHIVRSKNINLWVLFSFLLINTFFIFVQAFAEQSIYWFNKCPCWPSPQWFVSTTRSNFLDLKWLFFLRTVNRISIMNHSLSPALFGLVYPFCLGKTTKSCSELQKITLLRQFQFEKDLWIITEDENIRNYGYIGISILRIYWIYQRYIGEYFDTKYRWI